MHTKFKQHKELGRFYRALWSWIMEGCPQDPYFRTDKAICATLNTWLTYKTKLGPYMREHIVINHTSVLHEYFSNDNLPFNKNITHFSKERANYTIYKNKLRLAWIYKQSR